MSESVFLLAIIFFFAACLYSTVGHGGASAYLAVTALAGFTSRGHAPLRALDERGRVGYRHGFFLSRRAFPHASFLAVHGTFRINGLARQDDRFASEDFSVFGGGESSGCRRSALHS